MNEELTLRIIQGDRKHMSVEVIAIGGYQEVGKNMTAVKIGEDVVILIWVFILTELVCMKIQILTECIA